MDESYIDKILGEEGVKTDVTINIKPVTYLNVGLVIGLSVFCGIMLASAAKKIFG